MILMGAIVFALNASPLRLIQDVPVPASIAGSALPSRLDYAAVDSRRRRLYIAYLGRDRVLAFDLRSRRFTGYATDVASAHGVLVVPEMKRLYASATGTDEIAAIDPDSLAVKTRAPGGDYPDGIAFDPRHERLFVSDEHGGTETVIDARRMRRVATIDLGGEAGNSQYDATSRRVLVDVQGRDDLVAVDTDALRIAGRYSLRGCSHDHGLLVDAVRRRAFVACDGNDVLLQVNLRTMRVVAIARVAAGPDVVALDPGRARLYVACESGFVSVFDVGGALMSKLGDQFIANEAHSIAVDRQTHLVYLPLEDIDGHPVLRIMAPR